jgi:hypothetical protein
MYRADYWIRAKTVTQLGIIGCAVGPLNEIARYALFGAALAASRSPVTAALVFGGSTLAIESTGALAAAPILDGPNADKFIRKLSTTLSKVNIERNKLINPAVQAGVALYGGSSVSMALNKLRDPEISKRRSRVFGLIVSAALAAVCTLLGFLIGEGIADPNLGTIAAAIAAVGAVITIGQWSKTRLRAKRARTSTRRKHESMIPLRHEKSGAFVAD